MKYLTKVINDKINNIASNMHDGENVGPTESKFKDKSLDLAI